MGNVEISMLNTNRLLSIMALFGDNQSNLARKIGINRSFLSKKIRRLAEFKISEIQKIKDVYNLSEKDVVDIFFDEH